MVAAFESMDKQGKGFLGFADVVEAAAFAKMPLDEASIVAMLQEEGGAPDAVSRDDFLKLMAAAGMYKPAKKAKKAPPARAKKEPKKRASAGAKKKKVAAAIIIDDSD